MHCTSEEINIPKCNLNPISGEILTAESSVPVKIKLFFLNKSEVNDNIVCVNKIEK